MDKRLTAIDEALKAGRAGDAVAMIIELLTEAPDQPSQVYRVLLIHLYRAGRMEEGETWSAKAVEKHPRETEFWNLRGVFLTTRKALQLMLPGPGSIINIASVAALRGYYPGFVSLQVNYSTAKAGVIGFTRQVAAEYAKEKIRVNAIAPGWHGGTALAAERRAVSTPEQMAQFEKALHERIPMKHRGVPDDLVGLAVYLASDASHYVTGQVIAHDGGWDAAIV